MPNVNEQMLQSGFAAGGMKQDPVSGNEVPVGSLPHEVRDDVPAQLSEGEFVLPADVVRYIGLQKLMQLRDKAKEGLARMAEMGQMGNAEEAKVNGENPLGEFDEEDDDGFEAEIDDIMGGEVEMATGGAVPSKGNVLGQDASTYHWGNIANVQGARRESASDYSAPKITEALRKLGYQGPSTYTEIPSDKAFLAKELGVDSAEIEAEWLRIGDSVNPNQAEWRQQEYLDSLRNQVAAKNIQNFLSEKGFNVETWNTGAENISQLRDNEGNVLAVDANNYARTNARNDRNALAAGAAFMGGAMLYGGALGGAGAGAGAGEGAATVGTEVGSTGTGIDSFMNGVQYGDVPVGQSVGSVAGDIGAAPGFGSVGGSPAFTLPATSTDPSLLDRAKDYVIKKVTDPTEIAKTVGKEVVKDAIGGGKGGGSSGIPSWFVGAGLGAAAGSALGGGSSSSAPSSKTEIPRGNNPVVDYRPADAQTEELFINNRPTGKKKKKGFAAGGDVNLDAYNFFNQQD